MDNIPSNPKKTMEVSPLDEVANLPGGPQNAGVFLREYRHIGKLNLRGNAEDNQFTKTVNKVFGQRLPIKPNTYAKKNDKSIIWLGPDEWLITCPSGDEKALENNLKQSLNETLNSVTNVSDNSTIIQIKGSRTRTVLMKGCAIDIHPRVFVPGNVAQTNLAAASITFWQLDLVPTYNILVRASFASYLWNWLIDAGSEFGINIGSEI